MNHSRKNGTVQYFHGPVKIYGTVYAVKAFIEPRKNPPHVGADSPRFMNPGKAARVVYYELINDEGEDVTSTFFLSQEEKAIEKMILKAHEEDIFNFVADRVMEVV